MMGKGRRSILTGCSVLLVAMGVQGLTPASGSLASSWLFRHVTSAWPGGRAPLDSVPAPVSTPMPGGGQDFAPSEADSTMAAEPSRRGRPAADAPLTVPIVPIGPRAGLRGSFPLSAQSLDALSRASDGLTAALCRYRC